jgi:hypothetical protein
MTRDRSTIRSIAYAGLVLLAIAIGAHVVWSLLNPMLPALLAIILTAMIAYLILGRRS